ncbi:ubiquitin carboxyl-terminal hydrolase 26-like isoform X3 [Glycine soja]|uniref:ubiquitin carboxyl-terminal hydrolase 26-like isoform X3 n=1 Tax=Glycine soja TaxID=3848 RepID=UPI00103B5F7C|nr:ubiquitin carboxyl-terminal hydrolase 26-like isoform X3 [Glycine soja]
MLFLSRFLNSCSLQEGCLTIVSENDWKCFCEEWGGIETKGMSATIDHVNDSENVLTRSSEEMLVCKDQLSTTNKMNFENGTGQILIKTCPEEVNFVQTLSLQFLLMR